MFLRRAATSLTILTAAPTMSIATATVAQALSCDRPINGTFTATSDGQWAKTREVFHDEATVVTTWTVSSTCDDVMHCAGNIHSQQGWNSDLRCQSGHWYTTHRIQDWQPCPDGSTTPGDQSFRFWRVSDDPETFKGYDRTIGPSGGCGVNLWLTVEMPLTITKTG
ncbi:putative secreted protein [Mycolicibacterium fortuitum]|uniref:Putative secreted protein n=1 Tax=Mycolicibacterium fortuitum TaxID=1766 RepID=A0A378U7U8_MYCFO|nr:putative secreted protein [Mycolicibacterium fortuitum]